MEHLRDPAYASVAGAVVGLVLALTVIYGMKPKCCMAEDSTASFPKFDNQKVGIYTVIAMLAGAAIGFFAAKAQQGSPAVQGYAPVPSAAPAVPMGFRFAFEDRKNCYGFGSECGACSM